jgi:glycosyltransferase involved in cell wall biosynthesis
LTNPFLSIVFPAHNEEQRLPATLENTIEFVHKQPFESEIVVVENGSQDRTLEIARSFEGRIPDYQVIRMAEKGKGRAVQRGMLAATGQYRFFADADLSMPVDEMVNFLPPRIPDMQVAIASREAPGAVRYHEPAFRHLVGRVFNTFVRVMALPGLQDTQCGFKCFRGDIVEEIFPLQTLMGWSFDVELLYIARRRGYKIVEIPIPWYFNADSKVRVAKDSLNMAMDMLAIRRNARAGCYDHGLARSSS